MIHSVLLPNFCCHLFYINQNDPHFSVHAHFSTLALVKLSSFMDISACCFDVRKIYKVKHSDILKMIGKWLKHTSWSYLGQSSNSSLKQLLTWMHQYIHLTSPLKGGCIYLLLIVIGHIITENVTMALYLDAEKEIGI